MKIAHVALWTADLDGNADFWRDHFDAVIGARYESRRQPGFTSRMASLPSGIVIELMAAPWIISDDPSPRSGWAHIALSLGSADAVDAAAVRFNGAGLLVSAPRMTGDGFYEAVVRAGDGTLVELTA
ncbi:MAG: VOC family protein [Pseudomonadota bacterium]|uniref:VOC family protein n=1 Tax=Sphingomonas sp. ERG5 TaxID=1381597 RepID=UPI00054B2EE7|nr:VOC family protein [Sphingomonas sp. ERG5]